jgi:hypothetical protein
MTSEDDLEIGAIELPERIYKRVEWIIKMFNAIKNYFLSFKPKKFRISGIEFLTKEGTPLKFYLNEKHHIDNHYGPCKADGHCLIEPVLKITAGKDKVKIIFQGNHKFIYSQVSIRTTYLKKV